MIDYIRNPLLNNPILPVDIVLHPSWWFKHEGISFDSDFFYNPSKRVEAERQMEQGLYERWGTFGFGEDHNRDLPQIGAVHLAAGFLISEMLGCQVDYQEDTPPNVIPAEKEDMHIDIDAAFHSEAFSRFIQLTDSLKKKYGYLVGDVNWSGVLNLAMDLHGEKFFIDMFDKPDKARAYLQNIGLVIEKFCKYIEGETGTTSISVNRSVRFFDRPVYLHSECSHTMISTENYEQFLMPIDCAWNEKHRPFGIHYCGIDPHRYAETFTKLPYLDFLDIGWGGDVKILRKFLPQTFLNIRLSPVEIVQQSEEDIRQTIIRLVHDSANPFLTGICCINMDDKVGDEKITAIFKTVDELRRQYEADGKL